MPTKFNGVARDVKTLLLIGAEKREAEKADRGLHMLRKAAEEERERRVEARRRGARINAEYEARRPAEELLSR